MTFISLIQKIIDFSQVIVNIDETSDTKESVSRAFLDTLILTQTQPVITETPITSISQMSDI